MKIVCEQPVLAAAVGVVQNAISSKTTLPILSHMLLEATPPNELRLAATDLEFGITHTSAATVTEPGAIAVPAKRVSEIIRELPEGQVTLTTKKNNQLTIECGGCFFKVLGLPKEEFPKLPPPPHDALLTIPQQQLKHMLSLTAFAMSRDESRYVLNGALMVVQPDTLRVVATDGRRLALIDQPGAFPKHTHQEAIIPIKTVHELLRLLEPDGEVQIFLKDKQAVFLFNNTTIVSRLIEGEFPRYEQVIPKETKQMFLVDRMKFLQAARRASLLTTPNSQSIQIDLLKSKMVVSKHAAEIGEAREELDVPYEGEALAIGFNPQYLIDMLKSVEEPEVQLELTHPERPGILRTNSRYLYLVLPMQLT